MTEATLVIFDARVLWIFFAFIVSVCNMLRVQPESGRNSSKGDGFLCSSYDLNFGRVKGSHIAIKLVSSSKADTHYLLFCCLVANKKSTLEC